MESSRITREPPQARSSYDPHTRRITLAPDATPYQLAHELSHQAQQHHVTTCWLIRESIPTWMPYLYRLATVLVELECCRMARRALRHAGAWDPDAATEGSRCVRHYLAALIWTPSSPETAATPPSKTTDPTT